MNIANYFTFLRIVIIPLFPLVYLQYGWFGISEKLMPLVLLLILVVCEITDLIDGFIARKRNEVTDFGKVFDPMADSITNITVFFTFTQGWISIPILLVFVFLYREFFISTLRTICALNGFALAARTSGKIKTILQAVINICIVLLMIPYTFGYISLNFLQKTSLFAIIIAATYTIISAVDYIYVNRGFLKKALFK